MKSTPSLTVVLPLIDDRGHGLDALESWLRQESTESFEIVLVANREARSLVGRVQPLLRQQDRLIESAEASEMELYQAGGEAARAPLVLFTEAHCLPATDVVAAVVRQAAGSQAVAWVLGGGSIANNEFAGFESRLLLDGRDEYAEDAWRSVSLRGLAVRREAWLATGGFEVSCERLAESILGVRLERAGRSVERCAAARIEHGNCSRPAELEAALRPHGRGQAVWRERCEQGLEREFLPPLPDWSDRARWRRRLAWCSLRLELHRARSVRPSVRPLVARLAAVVLGPAGPRWLAATRARWALGSSRFAWSAQRRYLAYCRASSELLRWGVLEHAATSPLPKAPDVPGEILPARLPDGVFAGFYPAERWSAEDTQPRARWTRPVALMRLALPAGGYRMTLDAHLPAGTNPSDVGVWWNGRRLPVSDDGSYRLECRHFRRHVPDEQLLGFTSPAFLPAHHGLDDSRQLGIALFAIRFEPLEPVPSD